MKVFKSWAPVTPDLIDKSLWAPCDSSKSTAWHTCNVPLNFDFEGHVVVKMKVKPLIRSTSIYITLWPPQCDFCTLLQDYLKGNPLPLYWVWYLRNNSVKEKNVPVEHHGYISQQSTHACRNTVINVHGHLYNIVHWHNVRTCTAITWQPNFLSLTGLQPVPYFLKYGGSACTFLVQELRYYSMIISWNL